MASLMKSVSNWFRGKKDTAASAMADPIRDGKFAIEDSEKMIANFQSKIAMLMAETKKLERQKVDAESEAQKYTAIAQKAAAAGNEEDVRTSIQHKNNAQTKVGTLTQEIEKNESITQNLRAQLAKSRTKVAEAKSNHTRLVARHEGAKVRQELAKATSEFNSGDNPLSALNDLQKAVDTEESEAEAWEELVGAENPAAALEDKYATGTPEEDDEVAKMMAAAQGK